MPEAEVPLPDDPNETPDLAVDDAQQPVDEPSEDESEQLSPEQQIERLREELQHANTEAMRFLADLDNYRKRTQRDQQQERRYAQMPLLRDLLPVLDNLQRAIDAAETATENDTAAGLLEGVKLVAEQIVATLGKHHCQPIDAEGQPFDPHFHEAILQQPSEQHEPGTVMHVAQIGYRLHDRVIRPTQVIVAAKTEPA